MAIEIESSRILRSIFISEKINFERRYLVFALKSFYFLNISMIDDSLTDCLPDVINSYIIKKPFQSIINI